MKEEEKNFCTPARALWEKGGWKDSRSWIRRRMANYFCPIHLKERGPLPFVTGKGGYLAHEKKNCSNFEIKWRHVPNIITE